MSSVRQRAAILALLEAASGDDAALRNILLQPALLGADRTSPIGKLYPDTRDYTALNVAKLVHAFCLAEWGVSVREAILDSGKPAGRRFREDAANVAALVVTPTYDKLLTAGLPTSQPVKSYDWRRIARAMGDKGWRRYYSTEELDEML